jgi:hypothetical protein
LLIAAEGNNSTNVGISQKNVGNGYHNKLISSKDILFITIDLSIFIIIKG